MFWLITVDVDWAENIEPFCKLEKFEPSDLAVSFTMEFFRPFVVFEFKRDKFSIRISINGM